MKTFKISKKDLTLDNKSGVSCFEGNLEIDGDLGTVFFDHNLIVTGYILAKAGSGIKAGLGIEAGDGIKAGSGIEAGSGIKAGWGIEAGSGIKAGLRIEAKTLSAGSSYNIYAGISAWYKSSDIDNSIRIEKLISGNIICGKLIVTEIKKENCCSGKIVEIDGKKYKLVEA